jgi:putative endopeptidase
MRFLTILLIVFLIPTHIFSQTKGFDVNQMDETIEACDDFYQYSNGAWLKNTVIPPQSRWWGNFKIISENNQKVLKEIIENASTKKNKQGSDNQLIGDYYTTCMDESEVEKIGISPIKPYLVEISKINTHKELQQMIAKLDSLGLGGIFGFQVNADDKNNKKNLITVSQGGTGLPNRDYWFKDDEKSLETRQKYSEFVSNMFKHSGDSTEMASRNMRIITKIQKRFASASKSPEDLRDSEANYNIKNLNELKAISANFSWVNYLANRGVSVVKQLNIAQPKFFEEFNKMMIEVSIDDWKIYLRWNVINSSAGQLSKKFRDEQFNFSNRYLLGVQQQQDRAKSCTAEIDSFLSESIGQEFVKRKFLPESKKLINNLIDNLLAVYKQRIKALEWMDETTKSKAYDKLANFNKKIGYPDKIKGYKGLKIDRNSYFNNNLKSSAFLIKRNLAKADKFVERDEWFTSPQTVNAFYDPILNEIIFPAGILQPPFFDSKADDAITYGGIGSVIGHEITHGFDDQGSLYNPDGNLIAWWKKSDIDSFNDKAACLVDQFNKYNVVDEVFLNGKLTLGENIADLGGLTMSYYAFEKSLEGKPKPTNIDGFTPQQLFFLGWAQAWAEKSTSQREIFIAQTNPHSISRFRVNGPLSNMPEFKEAFGCKEKDRMVRTDVCKIW